MALVIIHRIVLCEKIVPYSKRAWAPTEAAAEFGPRGMPLDLVEDWAALCFRQAVQARDVERGGVLCLCRQLSH